MKRKSAFLILSGLLLNICSFAQLSINQYHFITSKSVIAEPLISYDFDNNNYLETRFNYDAPNTFSIYGGKTFEKNGLLSFSATPLLGILYGQLKGVSAGANIEATYKKFSFSTSPQYTLSAKNKFDSYLYSWSDLIYSITPLIDAGFSVQHTKSYQTKNVIDKGLLIQANLKNWHFPMYLFNPLSANRSLVMGISIDIALKNKNLTSKTKSKVLPDSVQNQLFLNKILPKETQITSPLAEAYHSLYALKINVADKTTANKILLSMDATFKTHSIIIQNDDGCSILITNFKEKQTAQKFLKENIDPQLEFSLTAYQQKNIIVTLQEKQALHF